MAGSTKKRTPRTVDIADHLWDRLEAMALEMGAERDTLVNQALHAFAREHGYLKPGELAGLLAPPPAESDEQKKDRAPDLKVAEAAAMKATGSNGPRAVQQPLTRGTDVSTSLNAQLYRPNERPGATSKMKALKPEPTPPPAKAEPTSPMATPRQETAPDIPVPDYFPSELTGGELAVPEHPGDRTVVGKLNERRLFVVVDGKITQEVVGARYVIGRDTSCQLSLPSTRISRQHVVVLKDATGFVIEDLGSSNGTWHKSERITRRPVQHGEEYAIGDINLRFEYR